MFSRTPTPDTQSPNRARKPAWREHLESILLGVALALVIRAFVIQAYKIPSGSMQPTLLAGDRILVNKFIYRFRAPQRGDVIVFRYPEEPKREFIKRLAAVGGETVALHSGQLVVNGEVIAMPPFDRVTYENRGQLSSPDMALAVPPETYFVLGDNSTSSRDSRYWGFVPKKYLIGKALVIFWPIKRWQVVK